MVPLARRVMLDRPEQPDHKDHKDHKDPLALLDLTEQQVHLAYKVK
jgi:hypothetical protein